MANTGNRMQWFEEARFGMFIHWGLYAIPARGEWVRSMERIPVEDYQLYFEEFNPVDYAPAKWARLAKAAGMKYAVLTAKHHDGFCLFDSQYTDYKATNTPVGRDLVKEYLDAFRKEGIRVGLYFSVIDWHHPDFPHYGDRHHPMRDNPEYSNENRNFDRYLDYMHNQVKELVTGYGQLDILWFDFSYDHMSGETWRASELIQMVRSHQPDIVIDNRLDASESLLSGVPKPYAGDFASPEQIIPQEGVCDVHGKHVPWEACITMNNNWGFHQLDQNYKPASMCVRKLVECVSKDGNLLLNVGPDARGNIPQESVEILQSIGEWMDKNGQSIYGCGRSTLPKPEFGRITQNGKKLYFHVFDNPIGYLPLPGIKKEEISRIRLLATGAEMSISETWITDKYPETTFTSFGASPILPDERDTVVLVELK